MKPDSGRRTQTREGLIPRPATVTDNVNVLCKQMVMTTAARDVGAGQKRRSAEGTQGESGAMRGAPTSMTVCADHGRDGHDRSSKLVLSYRIYSYDAFITPRLNASIIKLRSA